MIAAPCFDPATWPHEAVACNLCGADETTPVVTRDRYGLPTTVVQCVRCGLRYITPRMTAEGYAAFYRDGYRPLLDQLEQRTTPLSLKALEADQQLYAWTMLPKLAPYLSEGGTVLDIGGSTGVVARAVKARYGGRAIVIDPSAEELARAKGCETICASAEHLETLPTADVALLCRTLDHLLDPLRVLRMARAAVRTLVVDIMAVDGWPAGSQYKVDHPYAFTEDTATAMVQAAGWTPQTTWHLRGRRYFGMVCQ